MHYRKGNLNQQMKPCYQHKNRKGFFLVFHVCVMLRKNQGHQIGNQWDNIIRRRWYEVDS